MDNNDIFYSLIDEVNDFNAFINVSVGLYCCDREVYQCISFADSPWELETWLESHLDSLPLDLPLYRGFSYEINLL